MKKLIVRVAQVCKSSVEKWLNVSTTVIELARGYVSDLLRGVYQFWDKYRAIILNLPTGMGKTTFVISDIVQNAIHKGKRVLIVSNRIALDLDIKKRIAKLQGLFTDYPDEILRDIDDFGLITVTTYQRLCKYLNDDDFCQGVSYFVADEVHFFTSDSLFNSSTCYLMYEIPKLFKNSVRIYISATIDEVFPYICDAECNQLAIERWRIRFLCDKQQRTLLLNYNQWKSFGLNSELTERFESDCLDAQYAPLPIVYKGIFDTKYISLKFYSDPNYVEEIIRGSNDKSIVFVESKKRGSKLAETLPDSSYMTSDINKEKPELMQEIIKTEAFPTKTLITTSVFSNGCNINDPSVKNIFIENISPTDIIQMAGRRRKISKDDRFMVYIKIPEPEMLEYYINNTVEKIKLIQDARENPDRFLNDAVKESPDAKKLKGLYFVSDGKPVFNQIAIDMLHKNNLYYSEIKEMIETKGESEYCKTIAKLFNKSFKKEMIVEPYNYKQDTIEWLESLVGQEINVNDFGEELKMNIFKFNAKARERSDRTLGINALNNRLKNNELPFRVVSEAGKYLIEKE